MVIEWYIPTRYVAKRKHYLAETGKVLPFPPLLFVEEMKKAEEGILPVPPPWHS